jgi:large subunit ribosomal protein L29
MKPAELRQLQDDELGAKLEELRDNLFNLRIKHATGQLEDSASVRVARRELARAMTIVSERGRAK